MDLRKGAEIRLSEEEAQLAMCKEIEGGPSNQSQKEFVYEADSLSEVAKYLSDLIQDGEADLDLLPNEPPIDSEDDIPF